MLLLALVTFRMIVLIMLMKEKIAKFCVLHYVCDIFCDKVDTDDRKGYDTITKAFVIFSSKLITLFTKKAHPEKFSKIPG